MLIPRLESVLTDIEGTDRAEQTCAGAFEYIKQDGPVAVDNIDINAEDVQKVIRDGEVLIIRDGKTYNVMGQIVR